MTSSSPNSICSVPSFSTISIHWTDAEDSLRLLWNSLKLPCCTTNNDGWDDDEVTTTWSSFVFLSTSIATTSHQPSSPLLTLDSFVSPLITNNASSLIVEDRGFLLLRRWCFGMVIFNQLLLPLLLHGWSCPLMVPMGVPFDQLHH